KASPTGWISIFLLSEMCCIFSAIGRIRKGLDASILTHDENILSINAFNAYFIRLSRLLSKTPKWLDNEQSRVLRGLKPRFSGINGR
ncbi:hypothetical protein, partial [uncultured Kosakonia sp.]|uniref:hypothetical protein n=1 Tax=uncultured Kosakonia sp. TaxID=1588927 RepID=UPI002596C0A7